ncbi:MAG TPA: excinuclease ABC subunit UvrA [Coleofasciculaceae cyanobacterium]|jgi:excinuclease ABC subunit A
MMNEHAQMMVELPEWPPLGDNSGMSPQEIKITGARVNNLKNVDCSLPHEKITVITGPSGSGKSSLAFDTLYAEGQRRYIESMSSYARQFLARIEKPDVDHIQHILPAIALEQKNHVKNARSTVGTATEIYDFLRILYASVGKTVCNVCGGDVSRADPFKIQKELQQYPEGLKVLLLAPVLLKDFSVEDLVRQGFFRIYRNGEMSDINTEKDELSSHDTVRIVIDRLIVKRKALGARLLESIRNALVLGNGNIEVLTLDSGESKTFRNAFACLECHQEFTEPFPNLFSFNSPMGACPSCEGFGRIIGIDLDKVIPNKSLTLQQGAINPFTKPSFVEGYDYLAKECKKRKIPLDVPWEKLTDDQKAFVIDGGGEFDGIRGFFDWLETKKYKVHVRVFLAKYRGYYPCPDCLGSRLRRDALSVQVGGKNILEIGEMPVGELVAFFEQLQLPPTHEIIADRLLKEIRNRLHYLQNIGLTYLTINRQFRTLSNGEAQRINLSAALGSALTDTLYVLDEPTVGLHARDTDRLIRILKNLRDHGNTIVVVEHDPEVMLAADYIVDMGPAGGEEGGRIVYEGSPEGLLKVPYSLTARYLINPSQSEIFTGNGGDQKAGAESGSKSPGRRKKGEDAGEMIGIRGARGNNLQNLSVQFPKNRLVCVTGVSGSGKSTLIKQTLFAAYEHLQSRSLQLDEAPHDELTGLDEFKDVLLVDQSPPGRSARSNPITYVKAYDDIRKLFAESRKAMVLGITPGHFSFNTPGGRCETCEGLGTLTIDMQFMADVTIVCHDCQGRRFNQNVLSIEVDGKNINDVLNLTVDEALKFFGPYKKITNKLRPLQEIGLGYLKLGQSTSTLSGGEAQRLKLASYLPTTRHEENAGSLNNTARAREKYLFLFDEPTTGLHMADIDLLVQAFRRLIAVGHSLIVIEHNIDFIAQADWIVDLGPEGGDGGGQIIAEGSLEEMMAVSQSHTARFLKKRLESPAVLKA